MSASLRHLRDNALAAHVGPLVVFSLFMAVPGWFRIENAALPWYQRGPEHWVYPAQTIACGALLLWWWKNYTLTPWRGLGVAFLFGAIGITVWIAPGIVLHLNRDREMTWPIWWEWLKWSDRFEGFDPTLLNVYPPGKAASIAMRFARMAVVVPLVEEIFWRGFLMRYIVAEIRQTEWQRVAFGTHHWASFAITTLAVTFIHNRPDWPAAFVWGVLMYALAVRTRSLGACVVMHAVGNLILGIYVLQTRQWGFW